MGTEALALEVIWPLSPLGTNIEDALKPEGGLPVLVKYFYGWLIFLGGLAAFISLVIAGFQYLTSAGDPGKMGDAMSRIKSAGLGLVLLLASVLILNTINPQLTQLKMSGPKSSELENLNITKEIEDMKPSFDSCEKIRVCSLANLRGECVDKNVEKDFISISIDELCSNRACSIMSLKTSYADKKTGGICQIDLYGKYNCDKNTILTSIGGAAYEDLSTVIQSKGETIQCVQVKGTKIQLPGL